MRAREIPTTQWSQVLEQFSRQHRAWLATVDRTQPGAAADARAVERPLASVTPHMAEGRISRIEIRFQENSRPAGSIQIEAPTTVRVEETVEGVASALQIVDEAGDCTRVHFRAAPLPEMLDGIAPGELPSA